MQPNDPSDFIFWYYTPMALTFSRQYVPKLTVFDCMDELSAFKFAPEELKHLENELLQKADIVFTGGQSLYQAKKHQHDNIHLFASSIDQSHFGKARGIDTCPADQTTEKVKIGFFGVIDERFDYELIGAIAANRPDWHIVLIGPVVKIDPNLLPKNANIHYLGAKTYQQLPEYIASWRVALIPFLLNESTRFISPTKTPEYLAAGLPVVSTPIADVISPYGEGKIVQIADGAKEFIAAIERALAQPADNTAWLSKIDAFLATNSWDKTCEDMLELMSETDARNHNLLTAKVQVNI
jgi:glycosyltransferase involved in cell wall biosynthesis